MFETPYQEFIYKRTYARWLPDLNRREKWNETLTRFEKFMIQSVPEEHHLEFTQAVDSIYHLNVMPSMRALWTAGPALDRENLAGYNCSAIVFDNPRRFSELLYLLMCGCGVGFSVERQFVNDLPEIPDLFAYDYVPVIVKDSKRGWAEGLNKIISMLYVGKMPMWDLSRVRPAGAPLKTFGGRASGPGPLHQLFTQVVHIFRGAAGRKLSSLEVHDIACHIANAVIVGGVDA